MKNMLGETPEAEEKQLLKLIRFWQGKLAENIIDVTTKTLIEITIKGLKIALIKKK